MKKIKNSLSNLRNEENTEYNNTKDKAELSTAIIIMAGLGVASIVSIAAFAGVGMEKGQSTANCIANGLGIENSINSKESCEIGAHGDGERSIRANFDDTSPFLIEDTILQQYTEQEKRIADDITSFSFKVEEFKNKKGRYPNPSELGQLKYSADRGAYPEFYHYNLEYCTSLSGSEYMIVANSWDNTIMYVSSANKQPGKYKVEGDMHAATGGDGYPPACYRGTKYSAADRAGLKELGIVDPKTNIFNPATGHRAAVAKDGNFWANWTR